MIYRVAVAIFCGVFLARVGWSATDRLEFEPGTGANGKRVVLIAGDEEYRSEESLPMLARILSHQHGFHCTVLFSFGPNDADWIDPNNQSGLRGLDALDDADLLILQTRFRRLTAAQAAHLTKYLNAGRPVIGLRTATHAFDGEGRFGDSLPYSQFGRQILGEQWVRHHGEHKIQGTRAVVEPNYRQHPILRGVKDIVCPSDVYAVTHLTDADQIVLRAAVTESLDATAPNVAGSINDPMQPLAWLHQYTAPDGKSQGTSFCVTAGASVDFLSADLRRLVVNAAYFLTAQSVPAEADVSFVAAYQPSFYGFISTENYWRDAKVVLAELRREPRRMPDPPNSPAWNHRSQTPQLFADGQRIALVGNSLGERMNLFGHFETMLHGSFPSKRLVVRNFCRPADEVSIRQRPDNYTKLDDPLEVFAPNYFFCFFGWNESFSIADTTVGDQGDLSEFHAFLTSYRAYLDDLTLRFTKSGDPPTLVLVSPIAFESTGSPYQPDGVAENARLERITEAIQSLAATRNDLFIDLFHATRTRFSKEPGAQFTINGVHLDEAGDRLVAEEMIAQLGIDDAIGLRSAEFERLRAAVNDKSWHHLQDYRMLNGWYVYGGRRTWDEQTFPVEYEKIRRMVSVRDQYVWDLAAGRPVLDRPDDSETGDVYIPETMFGTRDEGFRKMREPTSLQVPTPEQSIAQMRVPDGFEVRLFADESQFPELANPCQLSFDNRGRLWVACMENYPLWLPGTSRPNDRLLILEDTDGDGRADKKIVFYDQLICPTGFEFWNGGVLVIDQPRLLHLVDSDGDDRADEIVHLIDGIGTDDTHHTMGAWEYSNGGLLHMLEGVAVSTTLETPWGPFRSKGPAGCYVLDPRSWKVRHFRTPGYGNPWCLVFDRWGAGVVGDGTNAQQHWTSPLSGQAVNSRKTTPPIFDNQGMRPAVGNEFLWSRHLPDSMQGQFIYACVINMHGMPRFEVRDEESGVGMTGNRIDDLLVSDDMFFRPVDPQIGPDGAIWFGDWCNALIGHMQYSQRDPNRDRKHGRIYRMVYRDRPLLSPVTQHGKSIDELLTQLDSYELRTRYRARRELRDRHRDQVLAAVAQWADGTTDPQRLCEALWMQESFHALDPRLVERIFQSEDFRAAAAAVHAVAHGEGPELDRMEVMRNAMAHPHPRVRMEGLRGLSFVGTPEAAQMALSVAEQPMDSWLEYTLEHTLHALRPAIEASPDFLTDCSDFEREQYASYVLSTGPGGAIVKPLQIIDDVDAGERLRKGALDQLVAASGGNVEQGAKVFERVCASCHQVAGMGKNFGPDLTNLAQRSSRKEIIKSVVWPNDAISVGYVTLAIETDDGKTLHGFLVNETDSHVTMRIAEGELKRIAKREIEMRREMKASSMPEGLTKTIAPIEFLHLIAYLQSLKPGT